jgi:hypothetical protein
MQVMMETNRLMLMIDEVVSVAVAIVLQLMLKRMMQATDQWMWLTILDWAPQVETEDAEDAKVMTSLSLELTIRPE